MKPANGDGPRDSYVEQRLARYDAWVREGRIPFSSRVVPVRESLSAQQWVLPTEQVAELLRNARSFCLTNCECRSRERRCDNPVEICLLINDAADREVATGSGRRVSLEAAVDLLRQANERGLVHLAIYNPEQYVYAVCSCCPCCCHDLQFLRSFGRVDLVARSEYVAERDADACIHCGDCVERCLFGAYAREDDRVCFDAGACYGCGLCVTTCSAGAVALHRRERPS